jgi:LacI family transcriptional regulator
VRWLRQLPKPIAIYCASDVLANELSMFCLQAEHSVPQEIVILTSDNDDLLCGGSLPTLSSIRLPYRQVGRRAAEILEQQMANPGQEIYMELIDQPDIVERQSTLFKHVEDPVVEKALQWMNDHATHGIDVESAARVTGVSLRALEIRFKKALNHTPHQELNYIRLEAVKQMLREQDKTLEEIAEACCFSSGIYLSQFFRREAGMTPGMYRKAFRERGHL